MATTKKSPTPESARAAEPAAPRPEPTPRAARSSSARGSTSGSSARSFRARRGVSWAEIHIPAGSDVPAAWVERAPWLLEGEDAPVEVAGEYVAGEAAAELGGAPEQIEPGSPAGKE